MGPKLVLPFWVRVNLGVMAIVLPISPELESHYQMAFSLIPKTSFFEKEGPTPLREI